MNRIFDYDSSLIGALTKIGDCICTSAMWLLFSLPIVTMGAASTAMYATVYRCLRKNQTGLWQNFWNAFRENFKRSTLVWLVELFVLALLTLDVQVFRSLKLSGEAMGNLFWIAIFLWCAALTWTMYVAAYSARFNGSVREVLHFGFILVRLHPIKAFGVLIPVLAGLALSLMAPVLVLFAPAAVCWISSITIEKVFRQHMQPEDLEKETSGNQ